MKNDAPTKPSALDEARAELARREQRRDADLAQYGSAGSGGSSRSGHLSRRYDRHSALIGRAWEAVQRLEAADTASQLKATIQADIERAQTEVKARRRRAARSRSARTGHGAGDGARRSDR